MNRLEKSSLRLREHRQEQYRHLYFLVERVLSAYLKVAELAPIAAMQYDRDFPQQNTLSRVSLDYRIDIERATETALEGFPALQKAWFDLADNGKVSAALQRSIVTKCGRAYKHLDPNVYFGRGRAA